MFEPDFIHSIHTSPSAEELLLSRHADDASLAQALVGEYYAPVNRLALALLSNPQGAHQAAVETLAQAIVQARQYHSTLGVLPWLYRFAVQVCQRLEGHFPPLKRPPVYPSEAHARLWRWFDNLGRKERLLAILHYALGLSDDETAAVLGVRLNAVTAQLAIFHQELLRVQAGAPLDGSAGPVSEALESFTGRVLGDRWRLPRPSIDELEQAVGQVLDQAGKLRQAGQRLRQARYLAVIAFAVGIVVCGLIGAGAYLLWPQAAGLPTSSPTLAPGGPTPVTPAPQAELLTRRASSPQILQRLQVSASLWNTLWLDAQTTAYGPQSYIGPAKVYRSQAWISQPAESLEFFGALNTSPSLVHMITQGWVIDSNPTLGQSRAELWRGGLDSLLVTSDLHKLVFPGGEVWSSGQGWFDTIKDEEIAGRQAIVADWRDIRGVRRARLWVDAATGVVLRLQEYSAADGELLERETVVTEIAFDQSQPPPHLAEALNLAEPPLPTGQAGEPRLIQPTPTLALPQARRTPIVALDAPPGFNRSEGVLKFQFPNLLDTAYARTDTAGMPAELFADEFRLGPLKFGLPWALRCARSPDGSRLAFNTGSDGTTLPDDSLRWLNLSDPQKIYQPAPDLHASAFSFSPDSQEIALFATGAESALDGLYRITLATGERQLILPLLEARSLVWSPDSEFLALVGRAASHDLVSVIVIHLRTRVVTYNLGLDLYATQAPQSPLSSWGVTFPVEMGTMDTCARPGGSP